MTGRKNQPMTLDEFIKASKSKPFGGNSYVDEEGFESLYVRFGTRVIAGMRRDNVLDLANFTVTDKGKGTFTAFISRLRKDYPDMWLYVENVLNPRLPAKLVTLGFTKIRVTSGFEGPPCFVLIPEEKKCETQ